MSRPTRMSVTCLAVVLIVSLAVPAAARDATGSDATAGVAAVPVTSLAGVDRYETAVRVARAAYPDRARSVVLATGQEWADAVGGTSLAGVCEGPALLTEPDRIPSTVLDCIAELAPETVFVLGGEAAISQTALARLSSIGIGPEHVVRLAGRTRYRTAAAVASATVAASGAAWSGHAYLATGSSFADALSVGPVCAWTGDPTYLIDPGREESVIASMSAIGVTSVTILGGTNAVPAAIETAVATAMSGVRIDRLAGTDRYQTATKIAEYAVATAGFTNDVPGVATGAGFADAVTGGVLLGLQRAPLLLVSPSGVSDKTATWLYARRGTVRGFTVLGGKTAVPVRVRTELQHSLRAPVFNEDNAMVHVTRLAGMGARAAGGAAEHEAFDYIADRLRGYGYTVTVQNVYLPSGATSHNVIAEHAGSEPEVIVLGAHVDTKPPSPGGNDNASGVGVVLELARVLAAASTAPTVRFIAFGAEEIGGPTADDHHFGSRQYVAGLSSAQRARIQGMVSIDMVGYGETFNVRSLRVAPSTVVDSLRSCGTSVGQPLAFLLDPSSTGWSDHEAFEFAGIPAAWLEWRVDPVYHTTRDTAAHVQPSRVRATGRLLRTWILALAPDSLAALRS